MMTDIEQAIPEQWRGFFRVLMLPISWLIPVQRVLLAWVWQADAPMMTAAQRLLLALPVLTIVVGLWCTMLSSYTLMFRWNRTRYVGTLLVLWWDVARGTWLYWAGMVKLFFMAVGSAWGLVRLAVETALELVRDVVELPLVLTGNLTKSLRQPGVPWLAFLMTVLWSALEALIFSYILTPTIGEVISDFVGSASHRLLGPFLFVFFWACVAGSLACMHVMVEAIKSRDIPQAVQMLVVELFVMFFEVMFFYRELIDLLTPWVAQQTGAQLGLGPVLMLSSFSWLGIRGMVWFLFARYGTPTMVAIIARQRLPEEAAEEAREEQSQRRWDQVLVKLKAEQSWFETRAQAMLEAAVLPSFQLLAACLNFALALFVSEPLFSLPFKSLAEIEGTKGLLQKLSGKERIMLQEQVQ